MITLRTVVEGALGGLTFGIYHSVVSKRMIEQFNNDMRKEREQQLNKCIREVNQRYQQREKDLDLRLNYCESLRRVF